MTCSRCSEIHIIQGRTISKSIRPNVGHRVANPHFLQFFQATEHTVTYGADRIILNRNAADHSSQLSIFKAACTDILDLDIANLLRNHQIHHAHIFGNQGTGNQGAFLVGCIAVFRTIVTLQCHLIILLSVLLIDIGNPLAIRPNGLPCAGSRPCRLSGIKLRPIHPEIILRHILKKLTVKRSGAALIRELYLL